MLKFLDSVEQLYPDVLCYTKSVQYRNSNAGKDAGRWQAGRPLHAGEAKRHSSRTIGRGPSTEGVNQVAENVQFTTCVRLRDGVQFWKLHRQKDCTRLNS